MLDSSRVLKVCYKLQNLVCHRTELYFSENSDYYGYILWDANLL